jgi:tetratricopeptide (TPR) repeat protein
MNLAEVELKKLEEPTLTADERVLLRCRMAAELMHNGQYEGAREALGELWGGTGRRPQVEGLDERVAAEVLLQVGALSGWIGGSRQEAGAQEAAKDLISESLTIFESFGDSERVGVAHSELALCYWRAGGYDEARVLFTGAFRNLTETIERAKVLLRLATVEFSAGRPNDALDLLKNNAHIFDEQVSHALRASFHNQLALVLKQLGTKEGRSDYLDRAIIELTAAIHHYEQSGHERYRAYCENNLANLLRKLGYYGQAHEQLDRAGATFSRLNDAGLLAQVNETRAQVFIEEKKYREADRVIARSVQTLEKGGGSAILADALATQGVVWARLGDNNKSINLLSRALRVAEEAGALSNAGRAALTLIEEHGAGHALTSAELSRFYCHAEELLKGTQDAEDIGRLRACARVVMGRLAGLQFGDENFTLYEAVYELEARYIEQALEAAGGSVTRAAKLLGIRHQSFIAMLNSRHQSLLPKRRPFEKRLRSIIKESK